MQQTATLNHNLPWRVIEACGGGGRVSRALGVNKNAPWNWIARNKIPARYVMDLSRLSRGSFQPHHIRPDVFAPGQVVVEVPQGGADAVV